MTARVQERVIHSRWLGEIEADPESELFFPAGLPGFENHHRMMPLEIPSQRPIVYLQSLESDDLCFVALPVYVVDPAFRLHVGEDDRAVLQVADDVELSIGDDVLCLALLRKSDAVVEANLGAAIVINLRNRRGVQCVPATAGVTELYRLSAEGIWRPVC